MEEMEEEKDGVRAAQERELAELREKAANELSEVRRTPGWNEHPSWVRMALSPGLPGWVRMASSPGPTRLYNMASELQPFKVLIRRRDYRTGCRV